MRIILKSERTEGRRRGEEERDDEVVELDEDKKQNFVSTRVCLCERTSHIRDVSEFISECVFVSVSCALAHKHTCGYLESDFPSHTHTPPPCRSTSTPSLTLWDATIHC